MRVSCSVGYTTLEGDHGDDIDSVEVTCSRCQHTTESYGTSERSVNRCLVLLREQCPISERNFYVDN